MLLLVKFSVGFSPSYCNTVNCNQKLIDKDTHNDFIWGIHLRNFFFFNAFYTHTGCKLNFALARDIRKM